LSANGHGETTQFSKDDLRQNRRATTIDPPVKAFGDTKPDGKAPPPSERPEVDKPIRLFPTRRRCSGSWATPSPAPSRARRSRRS